VTKGLAQVYFNLSTLLEAGVPLLRSLNTVAAGARGPLHRSLLQLAETVAKGAPLTEAMERNHKVFVPLDIIIVRAAEESGNLAESFALLAKWHEFSQRIKKRILSGIALPFLLIHIAAFVAPAPALVLSGWQIGPYITSVLLILALFYVPAVIIIAVMRLTPQTGKARRALDRISLKIPVLKRALYKLALSRYCFVFHMLSKAGVPITQTAEMAADATGNLIVADLVRPAAASVKAGDPFSDGLSPKLPPEFIEPWRIGEETGAIDEIAKRLADINAEAAEFWFKEFARWFPIFVYVFVSVIIIIQIFKLAGVALSGMSDFQ